MNPSRKLTRQPLWRGFVLAMCLMAAQAGAQTVATVPADAQGTATAGAVSASAHLSALLADKRYAELEQQLSDRLSSALDSLPAYRALVRDMDDLMRAKSVNAASLDAWVASSRHGAALLVRARFLEAKAWKARGDKFSRQTPRENFARMDQLLAAARSDFEDSLDKLGKRCDFCYAGLLGTHMAQGNRQEGAAVLDQAMLAMGGGLATPLGYLSFLHPKWGGSWERMESFVARFTQEFPDSPGVPLLRGAFQAHRGDALAARDQPRQAQFVYEEGLRIDPANGYLWARLGAVAMAQNNHELVLRATDKALAATPHSVDALDTRAYALMLGKTPLDAVPFLEQSVALGSEWALQSLLPIVASGKYGFTPDRPYAERICQSAIDALLPSGYACMGGLHFFGMGRPVDKPRALHWFIQAAERGVAPAMVDAGIMLWQGDGGPSDPQRAIDLWLQARQAGEQRGDDKLRAHLSSWDYAWRVTLPDQMAAAQKFVDDRGMSMRMAVTLAGATLAVLGLVLGGALVAWLVALRRRRGAAGP